MDRVNVGCGTILLPGYINLDVDGAEGGVQCDVRDGLPFGNGELAEVRADQFIEHLTVDDLREFLRECARVLCQGGEIRLSFPDIAAIAGMAARRELDAVAHQECVDSGLGLLNYMGHGWGHKSILTLELVQREVTTWFEPMWACVVGTNGLLIARKR